MPPRKSNASTAAAALEEPARPASSDGLSVEDLNLPKSIVQRLAKGVLPPNTQIQKDALLAMSKSATVFVNYLTNEASEHAERGGKKTIQPKDVLEAIKELEFEGFSQRLEAEVNKYVAIQSEKRNSYRKKIRDEKNAQKDPKASRATNGNAESPPNKRARRSSGANVEHATGSEDDLDVDETLEDDQQDPEEDEEVEEDDVEVDEEGGEEKLTEDPIEVRDSEASDDDMEDGDESD
jgi:histone H3/H4